jgi:hypothetical protein
MLGVAQQHDGSEISVIHRESLSPSSCRSARPKRHREDEHDCGSPQGDRPSTSDGLGNFSSGTLAEEDSTEQQGASGQAGHQATPNTFAPVRIGRWVCCFVFHLVVDNVLTIRRPRTTS